MESEVLTRNEYTLMNQLKIRLLDLDLEDTQLSNQELIRWIRARDHNVNAAEEMFRNHIFWRHEIDLDNLISWQPNEMFPTKFPFSISGFDYEGCPVVIVQAGKMDFRTAVEEGYMEEGLRYLYRCIEQIVTTARKVSTNQECLKKVSAIIDLEGFQFRQIRSRVVLEQFAKVLQMYEANYPEILKTAFVVNVPTIFAIIYRICCRILSSKTLSKVQLHNGCVSKFSHEILKIMAPEEFPEKYGGSGLLSCNVLLNQVYNNN